MTEQLRKLRRAIRLRTKAQDALVASCFAEACLIMLKAPMWSVVLAFLVVLTVFGVWFALLFYVYELETDILDKESE